MQIIGFHLSQISVRREEKAEGKLSIKQNIHIEDIIQEKIPITKNETLKVKFIFSVDYNEGNFAKVEIKGNIILLPEKNELKDFLKEWADKQIPDSLKVPLFNFIMNKCNIRAMSLEDELNLPIHVQMPKLQLKKESGE